MTSSSTVMRSSRKLSWSKDARVGTMVETPEQEFMGSGQVAPTILLPSDGSLGGKISNMSTWPKVKETVCYGTSATVEQGRSMIHSRT